MKLDRKMIADLCEGASEATKRALGLLPPLAAPRSTRALDDARKAAVTAALGGWYCFCVDTMRQNKVVEDDFVPMGRLIDAFVALGAETYYPRGKQKKIIRHQGKPRTIEKLLPAFPGYLFVGFTKAVDWLAVKDIAGVFSVIGNPSTGEPRRISDMEIAAIRGKEGRGEYAYNWKGPKAPKFNVVQKDHVEAFGAAGGRFTGVVKTTPKSRKVEVIPDLFPDTVVHIDIAKLRVIP